MVIQLSQLEPFRDRRAGNKQDAAEIRPGHADSCGRLEEVSGRAERKAVAGRNRGRLLVVDAVLPENSDPHPAKLLDLVMLTVPGGRERTEPEWHDLLSKARFRISRIVPTRVGKSVIEAFAAD